MDRVERGDDRNHKRSVLMALFNWDQSVASVSSLHYLICIFYMFSMMPVAPFTNMV